MENGIIFLTIVIVLVITVVVVGLTYLQKQKRTKEMRAAAERLGFQFTEEERGLAQALGGFALFARGRGHTTTNLLRTAAEDAVLTILDNSYMIGAGRRQRTYRQTVLLLESEQLDLPAFALRPEGLGHKLLGLLGQQDINFEYQPDFSAAYLLQGPDEPQIRALFSSETLAFFARRRGLCVEGRGSQVLYYRANKRVSPEAIPSFVEEGLAILRLLSGKGAPAPAAEPDPLAGLDELLAEIGPGAPPGEG